MSKRRVHVEKCPIVASIPAKERITQTKLHIPLSAINAKLLMEVPLIFIPHDASIMVETLQVSCPKSLKQRAEAIPEMKCRNHQIRPFD